MFIQHTFKCLLLVALDTIVATRSYMARNDVCYVNFFQWTSWHSTSIKAIFHDRNMHSVEKEDTAFVKHIS